MELMRLGQQRTWRQDKSIDNGQWLHFTTATGMPGASKKKPFAGGGGLMDGGFTASGNPGYNIRVEPIAIKATQGENPELLFKDVDETVFGK